MLWLTDHPDTTAVFLPAGARWSRARAADLPAGPGGAWGLLGAGAECWRYPELSPRDPERCAILIDDAPASQFEILQTAPRAGLDPPDGLVALALTGSRFRGQRQRGWTAARGNLHLVAHYRLDLPAAATEAAAIMLPAVAAAESIERISEGRCAPAIKWVNDLILPAGKVAGALTSTQIEGERIVRALFGIGINLEQVPPVAESAFAPRAAALAQVDPALRGQLPGLFAALMAALDHEVEGLRRPGATDLYARYRARSACIGREVALWPCACDDLARAPPLAQGRVRDVLPDLSLVLEGRAESVRNARLALLPPSCGPSETPVLRL
ncbi:MAG: hypothetical protein JNM60_06855 [Candidatus Competibacteraceae bacterium]|nr:hypothetical protein [Candidatus Competibacteraceae bacterium]